MFDDYSEDIKVFNAVYTSMLQLGFVQHCTSCGLIDGTRGYCDYCGEHLDD